MKQIRHILYLSEPSLDQTEILKQAISLAKHHNSDLTLLEVMPEVLTQLNPLPQNLNIQELEAELQQQRYKQLKELVAGLEPDSEVSIQVRNGKRFVEAIRMVLAEQYDLLIKAAENPPWLNRLFGSDDMHLLRKCPCPLLIIKQGGNPEFKNVLLAMDFDTTDPGSALNPQNMSMLELSADVVANPETRLHILHCWQPPDEMLLKAWGNIDDKQTRQYVHDEKSAHQRSLQRIADTINPKLSHSGQGQRYAYFHLMEGPPQKVIPEQAHQIGADLLVMGSVARTGISGFFIGNTAEMVLEQVDCSVLIIKPAGFESPVKLDD